MFKPLENSFLRCFIFTIIITIFSCDGRDRKHKTNTEILTENNQLGAFRKSIKVVPESKIEIITDTILSNGFQIKIHYYFVDYDPVLKTRKTKKNAVRNTHYKNFEAKIHVSNDGIRVSKSILNKKLFYNFSNHSFWKDAIMQYVWIDYEASINNNIVLNTSF